MDDRLQKITEDLMSIKSNDTSVIALKGALTGALYAIKRSIQLEYSDISGEKLPSNYNETLNEVLSLMENNDIGSIENKWAAGFYFNSAIHRLAALNERITIHVLGKKSDLSKKLRQEGNKFKHEVDGLLSGRKCGIEEALSGLEMMVKFLLKNEKT